MIISYHFTWLSDNKVLCAGMIHIIAMQLHYMLYNYTRSLYEHLSVLSTVSKTLSIGMVIGTVVTALVIATLFSNETETAQVMQH